jgi:hypothetical protein
VVDQRPDGIYLASVHVGVAEYLHVPDQTTATVLQAVSLPVFCAHLLLDDYVLLTEAWWIDHSSPRAALLVMVASRPMPRVSRLCHMWIEGEGDDGENCEGEQNGYKADRRASTSGGTWIGHLP